MKKQDDFLVEILTEELPPKMLLHLGEGWSQQIQTRLQKAELSFDHIKFFATPRRLAILVKDLAGKQPDQVIERKGPAFRAAFDAEGNPTPACTGFARSCGVTPAQLKIIKNAQGEWVGFHQITAGKEVAELLPDIVTQALLAVPLTKRMRLGDHPTSFVRPIQGAMMLYGEKLIEGNLLGFPAGRTTRGHRFHAGDGYALMHAIEYESLLRNEAFVIADFESRRSEILSKAEAAVEAAFSFKASVLIDHALLDEVTGLVEWPVILIGHFEAEFLKLPSEVLVSAMQDHQRYFPVVDKEQHLLPHFVVVSNIQSTDSGRVIRGNERVLRARLSDAAFFFETDKKESLTARLSSLKGMVFQSRLGTLYEKSERLASLASFIVQGMKGDAESAARAGWLAKTDLTTNMVNEFPELQGTMGYYYALNEGLSKEMALALREHYLPRFAGDELPLSSLGQALALADRLDTLAGTFGIHQIPTGDKDPFGLRRAAMGIIRIVIEQKIDLSLQSVLTAAVSHYARQGMELENGNAVKEILSFIHERLRSFYQEQGVGSDVFHAVSALCDDCPYDLLDFHSRIKAVESFKKMPEAEALSVANKRVSNILAKYAESLPAQAIQTELLEEAAEKTLAERLASHHQSVEEMILHHQYDEALLQLAALRQPVDDFFDQVMVMTEDQPRRMNRLLLLQQLRSLFLQVADIALLQ